MSISVGIDLGTTNTSIAMYDGKRVDVAKQIGGAMGSGSETTPSAIFIDENHAMHIGDKAYVQVAARPEDVARGWKRLLGTGVEITFASAGVTHSPEWCSTELLKRVFSYLPAHVRNDSNVSVVVTVPAAFGQVKNDATLKAANEAGLLNVKLMPEPVAACMAVMDRDRSDKTFLVYDLGGGTFDVSVAKFVDNKGSIIAQGGIESAGGRDWDFAIVNKVVIPWILDNYNISPDLLNNTNIKNVLAMYADQAKIELSQSFSMQPDEDLTVYIQVPSGDIRINKERLTDLDGKEVGLNVPLKKSHIDELTAEFIDATVNSCRIVIADNGLELDAIDYMVFIGGPTLYQPLRDRVSQQLGINILPEHIDPMTAVAKGAAIYAESLADGETKPAEEVQESTTDFPLELSFDSRVAGSAANLTVTLKNLDLEAVKVHVRNAAYSSGELTVNFSKTIPLTLTEDGVNTFVVEVMVPGQSTTLSRTIEITKTLEIQGIPMATSLFVEVVSRDGSTTEPEYLVRVGEGLPKKGEFRVASQVELSKKSDNAIRFKLYQGEISDRVIDNTYIGELKLESSVLGRTDKISIGDELICGFEVGEGLELKLNVSVPSIGERFDGLYMPGEAVKNPTEDWQEFAESGRNLKKSLERYVQQNPNALLESRIGQLQDAIDMIESSLVDEEVQSAAEKVRQVRRDFFEARRGDLPRRLLARYQYTFDFFHSKFEGRVQANATNGERKVFLQHAANAEAAARAGNEALWDAEDDEMWEVLRAIIWRSEWWLRFELDSFKTRGSAEQRARAIDGLEHLNASDFDGARQALNELFASDNSDGPKLQGVDVRKI